MYYAYVLRDIITGQLYKGSTKDLKQRYEQHRNHEVQTTKSWKVELVYYEAFTTNKLARKEELFLKSGRGKERLKYILTEESGQDGNALVLKTSGSNP